MNKTVNINLANTFFHIDEEAYAKLRRYLESIKRSFANTKGSDEILMDIEARVAELFQEKMENDRQVITQKEVDEVITIMGQPEDYMVDEDIFEDEPRSKSTSSGRVKKLYRDINQKYIGGVSSGLGHYFGIDPLWIRLLWIVLTLGSGGGFIFIYILLWILIPEATTTAQKLDMRGEEVNISNIERKVKEGIDDVTERVKNADYDAMGNKVKDSGKSFFDALGDIIMFLFKVFGKFIGVLLIIIGASTLIGLFIGMFTVGILDVVHLPGFDMYELVDNTGIPIWLVSLLGFFAVGIPFFFLLYLGLKIVVNNLKSIGLIAKLSLLGLWLIAVITLTVFGIRNGIAHSSTGSVSTKEVLYVQKMDTIQISTASTELYENQENIHIGRLKVRYDEDGNRLLLSDDVRFNIKRTKDSVASIKIRKDADGSNYENARERARKIEYAYTTEGNNVILNDFLTTDIANKAMDQEIHITLYIPENTVIKFSEDASRHLGWGTDFDRDFFRNERADYLWKIEDSDELKCLDCPEEDDEDSFNSDDDEGHLIINEDGVDIDLQNEDGSFKVKINEDGVKVKADDNN